MNVPSGRLQFFALEASDYLERLSLIVARPNPPDGEELVRLTRALRGAALMAGLASFAQAAQAVEHCAKGYKDGSTPWTSSLAEVISDAVDELRRLVRQSPDWSDADSEAAEHLARSIGGGEARIREAAPPADEEIKPSVRAFVGREGALIAGTLEHAAQALELGRLGDSAEAVLHRLQALRGLATLPSLSPLPEFLDAVEVTLRTVREGAAPPAAPMALRRVAGAITQLAREIADLGAATGDGPEILGAARTLLASFGTEDDVVDISSLFVSGDSAPIVSRGNPPELRQTDLQIEFVSLADRFRQAADQLVAAAGTAARLLSLYGLSAQLGAISRDSRRERPELAQLLTAARVAIQTGAAEHAPDDFADALRTSAEQLARAAEGRNVVVFEDQFDQVVAIFGAIARPDELPTAAPFDSESDVVPIESLLAAPDAPPEPARSAFESSWTSYHLLLTEPVPAAPLVSAPAPTADDDGFAPEAPPDRFADVVAIDTLLYRGRRALERADLVRKELSRALKSELPFNEVEPLVSELIDLVPLALAE